MHQQFSFFAAFSFFTAIKPSTKRLATKRLATKHLRSAAAVDPTARNVIVARAVSNTLQQCVGEFVK